MLSNQLLNDILFVFIGVVGAWLTRRWRTPHEKATQNTELLGKLAKELDTTTDELIESFKERRKDKRTIELLIGYLIQTYEHMARHGLKPLPLPVELESDPELVKFFVKKKKAKGKR